MQVELTQQELKLVIWGLNTYVSEYDGVDSDEDIQLAQKLSDLLTLMQA